MAKRTYFNFFFFFGNCAAIYYMFVNIERNYYANYLTGIWISSFDPCISRGQIFGLIFRS